MELAVGGRGQFDVLVDGALVASKQQVSLFSRLLGSDGFPEIEATVDAVAARLGKD